MKEFLTKKYKTKDVLTGTGISKSVSDVLKDGSLTIKEDVSLFLTNADPSIELEIALTVMKDIL